MKTIKPHRIARTIVSRRVSAAAYERAGREQLADCDRRSVQFNTRLLLRALPARDVARLLAAS